MKKVSLTDNAKEQISKIIRKSKTQDNESAFVLIFEKKNLISRCGRENYNPEVTISFKSDDDYFFFNNFTKNGEVKTMDFEKLCVLVDLKKQRYFVNLNGEWIETLFVSVLFNDFNNEHAPNTFSRGIYCTEKGCVFLYDEDFCLAMFDAMSNLMSEIVVQDREKISTEEEDETDD